MPTKLEQKFSEDLRQALRDARCEVTQIIEAGIPGVPDLHLEFEPPGRKTVNFWVELKVDSKLRPGQRQFLNRHWARSRNAFMMKQDRSRGYYLLWAGDVPRTGMPDSSTALWISRTLDIASLQLAMVEAQDAAVLVAAQIPRPVRSIPRRLSRRSTVQTLPWHT